MSNCDQQATDQQAATVTLRYIEFYSGVGGWTMALQQAVQRVFPPVNEDDGNVGNGSNGSRSSSTVRLQCCAALDHSDLCTAVYQHNFNCAGARARVGDESELVQSTNHNRNNKHNHKPTRIETLTVSQVAAWKADLWMMSPPCQPHTRQHDQQHADLQDERSQSFLHICQLLNHSDWDRSNDDDQNQQQQQQLHQRPTCILLENVVGFEQSQSCRIWLQALHEAGYAIQQFQLQPTQVGLPNDRPRYYCVAVLQSRLDTNIDPTKDLWIRPNTSNTTPNAPFVCRTSLKECGIFPAASLDPDQLPQLGSFLDDDNAMGDSATSSANPHRRLRLSKALLQKPAAWCLDIVTRDCRRTSCFTSSYGKYLKGTGSVVLVGPSPVQENDNGSTIVDSSATKIQNKVSFRLVPPEQRQYDPDWNQALLVNNDDDSNKDGYYLRFLSGSELARLFDFAPEFAFPPNVTLSQQWKLLGNSLNVRVAARLVELALRATRPKDTKADEL